MAKKSDVIVNTSQLRDLVGSYERPPDHSGVFLRSEVYLALGCDLGNITRLEELLAREVDTSNALMLCTAEVSVTYMNTEAADALIHWAAQYSDSVDSHLPKPSSTVADAWKYVSASLSSICQAARDIPSHRR
jgi:tRNA wybutosine-synthesizing protein 4